MRINKLLGALGNLDKIAEGIKNKIFKKADIEAVAKLRWMECKVCPLLDRTGSSCAVPRTKPCCSDCGCSISLKIRSMSSDCPKGRWNAIMTPQMEHNLKRQVLDEEAKDHLIRMKEVRKKHDEKMNKNKKDANNI